MSTPIIAVDIREPTDEQRSGRISSFNLGEAIAFHQQPDGTRGEIIATRLIDFPDRHEYMEFGAQVAKATGIPEAATTIPDLMEKMWEQKIDEFEQALAQAKMGASTNSDWQPERLSQQANAEQLIVELDGNARFNVSAGDWMIYKKGRFVPDERGWVARAAKRVAKATWGFVEVPPADILPKIAFRHALDSEKASGIAAMMKLAQTEQGISITAGDLDKQGRYLNVLNGTIDLYTGLLQPHRREDLLSKQAPVVFDANATCTLWDSVLDRIQAGNGAMIHYLARIFGAAAAAQQALQELFIFHGGGANGKNVLLDTVCGLLGDYAGTAPDSLLTVRAMGAEHPTEIADLCGKRLVFASETEHGAKLRVQLVKRLTGDATLKGRFMRQDFFEFPRTHTLIMVTNNKPMIGETTHAIWRRVRLVPFNVTIPLEERDLQLTEKLKAEWPGILNWIVRGYLDFQQNGMQTPEDVLIATENYQAEQDPLSDFLAERCIRAEGQIAARSAIRNEYAAWAKSSGESDPLDTHAFYDQLRRVPGVEETMRRINGKPTKVFTGIGLANLSNQYRQAQEEMQDEA
jgi:putative DNA primase/helicase